MIGARDSKPRHEQALGLVSKVTVVVTVPALRGHISQVARFQRSGTLDTTRRASRCPVIDQYEFHGVRPLRLSMRAIHEALA